MLTLSNRSPHRKPVGKWVIFLVFSLPVRVLTSLVVTLFSPGSDFLHGEATRWCFPDIYDQIPLFALPNTGSAQT